MLSSACFLDLFSFDTTCIIAKRSPSAPNNGYVMNELVRRAYRASSIFLKRASGIGTFAACTVSKKMRSSIDFYKLTSYFWRDLAVATFFFMMKMATFWLDGTTRGISYTNVARICGTFLA